MSFVVSLEDFTPGQRYDSLPWIAARIEESEKRTGPWTLIETITFDDPDLDPTAPATRSFTSTDAIRATDWFRVVFIDAADAEQIAPAVYFPNPGVRPTLDDIASILWARTKDDVGETGTFTDSTRPTAEQVERLISDSIADVAMRAGTVPGGYEDVARSAAALRTAASIERSYFPEQANQSDSAYALFRDDYLELVEKLVFATWWRWKKLLA